MSSQEVPLLRPPMPGGRSQSGTKRPTLALGIPPSPSQRPVGGNGDPPLEVPRLTLGTRTGAPSLKLATPMGGQAVVQQDNNTRPRAESFNNQSVPGSAASSTYSNISSYMTRQMSTPDPSSAISSQYSEAGIGGGSDMERTGSMGGIAIDFEKLSLEKGSPLDVDDLDDDGWAAASDQGKIDQLGSLGEGAGGAVSRCKLQGGRKVFALKIITTSPDPDIKKQILRELKFNKNCVSDYICQYYGAFMDKSSSTISIAMEYCEGGSLDAVYREVKKLGGRTGEKVLGKVAEGVLHGLTYLNSRKIIHRDIKPSNILLCRNGQVKLCDFGVSGEFGTKGDANTFIGTSYYMAPERIQGQSYTITSDVWSLGVTLLEVAQHRFPFPADGTGQATHPTAGILDLLTYIVGQEVPKLKDEPENNIKWSENMKYFVACSMEKNPQRRATPWKMLEHPWIEEMHGKKVNMSVFLKKVWDWKD